MNKMNIPIEEGNIQQMLDKLSENEVGIFLIIIKQYI